MNYTVSDLARTDRITAACANSADALEHRGYTVTNTYADGAIRMQPSASMEAFADVEPLDVPFLFVRADGTISEPRTTRCVYERIQLERELGLRVAARSGQ